MSKFGVPTRYFTPQKHTTTKHVHIHFWTLHGSFAINDQWSIHFFIHWNGIKWICTTNILSPQFTAIQHNKWAVLKRSFISQGRKELLTPPLTHHLRGHSASLRVEIPVFCLRASLRWLTHLRALLTRTVLWPPPFLLHKGGFIAWLKWAWTASCPTQLPVQLPSTVPTLPLHSASLAWRRTWPGVSPGVKIQIRRVVNH